MKGNSVDLIQSIGRFLSNFKEKKDVRAFLQKITRLICKSLKVDVCSIYFYDPYLERLILEATEGLNPELIGKLMLTLDEGLVGQSLKDLSPVLESYGDRNPHYKSIEDSGEDQFNAFLALPMAIKNHRFGVLVLQDREADYFDRNDLLLLKRIVPQLTKTLKSVQGIMGVKTEETEESSSKGHSLITGESIVPGICIGRSYSMIDSYEDTLYKGLHQKCYLATKEDFSKALIKTEEQLQALQNEMEEKLADVASSIFSTHILMLKDSGFTGYIKEEINRGTQPCKAILDRVQHYIDIFSASDNPRLQEKVQDIQDLGHRILRNLANEESETGDYRGQIIIARELLPSELVKITAQHVEGLVLFSQGASAHITILAKSLGIPLIYTEDSKVFDIDVETPLVLDAGQGNLYIDPTEDNILRFKKQIEAQKIDEQELNRVKDSTYTACGTRVHLLSTINLLSDIPVANRLKSDGIGLYRSEFPFLIRNNFPSEEEQYQVYKQIFEKSEASLVTLRTLDIGGDKILSYLPDSEEDNPFLGLRALRFLLENKKVFVSQLKAMLRAGDGRDFRIMFPLVSSVDDFNQAKRMVDKSIEFLARDGFIVKKRPQLGVMIELPSAIAMADELTKISDFVSVGSNDFVQYLLGVDRTNERVAGFYEAKHPAVLRSLKQVAVAAIKNSCSLSLCGNMSSNLELIPFLLGIGFRNLSIPPKQIPKVQSFIEDLNIETLEKESQSLLSFSTLDEINEFVEKKKRP